MDWMDVRIIVIILMLVLLPGWALLAVTGYWKKWNPLQRWLLSLSLGIAFWPVLYYFSRTLFPMIRIGTNKIILILLFSAVISIWKFGKNWQENFKFESLDYLVLLVLAITLFTRFVMIVEYPYPSWTDSLHHTLITDITATTGKLPYTLVPYETTSLAEYHLGLYGLTAPLQLLTNLPAHSALLWMAQFLNGICGIGVFLFLDKKVSRAAGLVGLITSGLLSFQPALYFSWGRFTQLGAQSILMQATLMFWLVLEEKKSLREIKDWTKSGELLLTGLMLAGLALIHFRVAAYAIPLLLIIFIWEMVFPQKNKQTRLNMLVYSFIVAGITLVLILPALVPALSGYLAPSQVIDSSLTRDVPGTYFGGFTWKTFYAIGLHKWLAILSLIGIVFGLLREKTRKISIMMALWCLALLSQGYLYQTGIGQLAFTNLTGNMIMAYLPAGVLVGLLVEPNIKWFSSIKVDIQPFLVSLAILAGVIAGFDRVDQFENHRYFMTSADEEAMEWISKNTPPDSLFGINTHFWLVNAAHGSDGGYWLPYFAGRKTTTGVMISNYNDDYNRILEMDNAIVDLYNDPDQIEHLCELGVDYLYSGAKSPFDGNDFNMEELESLTGTEMVYDFAGVQVLKICGD